MNLKLIHLIIILLILIILPNPVQKYVTCDYTRDNRPFPSGNMPQGAVVNVVY